MGAMQNPHFSTADFAAFPLAEMPLVCYHLSRKQGTALTKEKTT